MATKKHKLSDSSKRASEIRITDKDLPDMKNHSVGSKHHFMVEAEHVSSSKNDAEMYGMPAMDPKTGKPMKPDHTMRATYRIHSITPVAPGKDKTQMPARKKGKKVVKSKPGQKVARYKGTKQEAPQTA